MLVIDLGDVVCHFRPEPRMERLAAISGLSEQEVRRRWWESGLEKAAESGRLGPDVYGPVREALAIDTPDDELRATWSLAFVPNPAVVDLVARVAAPTVLFTNNGPIVSDCLRHELVEVQQHFEHIVCSWHIGHRKPSPEAFTTLAGELGAEPGRLVFVDDSQANVDAARGVGLDALRFTTPDGLRAALARRGLLVM
ncbi:MAG: HAD family hydrolase [Acidimicrobiales bacterium]